MPSRFTPPIPLSLYFESAEQTITSAGALQLAHGFGIIPKLIQVDLVCKTAQEGYSIGDVVSWGNGSWLYFTGTPYSVGVQIAKDSTNLNVRYGSSAFSFFILNKTTGVIGNLTNSFWKAIFRAWA